MNAAANACMALLPFRGRDPLIQMVFSSPSAAPGRNIFTPSTWSGVSAALDSMYSTRETSGFLSFLNIGNPADAPSQVSVMSVNNTLRSMFG